jgi:ABC-type multidrug transport system fused ATPase/permease subunit
MEKAKGLRPGITAMVAGGVAALLLYGWFLTVYLAPNLGPGDAVVGQAIEALMAVSLFWLVLFVLLAMPVLALAYVLLGRLPERQAARAQAAALLPMAALAAYAIKRFLF